MEDVQTKVIGVIDLNLCKQIGQAGDGRGAVGRGLIGEKCQRVGRFSGMIKLHLCNSLVVAWVKSPVDVVNQSAATKYKGLSNKASHLLRN